MRIDLDALGALEPAARRPTLDPERHYLEGSPRGRRRLPAVLDAINFGSGWFPTLRKRAGLPSGYFTVAWALADHFRAHGAVDERASCAR